MKNRFLHCLVSLATTAMFVGVLASSTALEAQSKGAITLVSQPLNSTPDAALSVLSPGAPEKQCTAVQKVTYREVVRGDYSLCVSFDKGHLKVETRVAKLECNNFGWIPLTTRCTFLDIGDRLNLQMGTRLIRDGEIIVDSHRIQKTSGLSNEISLEDDF